MALRAAKADKDAAQPLWGQRFGAAAELPLGPELYVNAGSAGDLVAGVLKQPESRLQRSVYVNCPHVSRGLFLRNLDSTPNPEFEKLCTGAP
jgi:hypothetical protein